MTDSILILGSGVAGLHSAMECAKGGARAIVVEQGPMVGGRLAAALTKASAIGDRAEGASVPLLKALADNQNIEIITLANLHKIEGRPGNFSVSIRERARFVTDACTRCNNCRAACPVVLPNEFDAGLTYRKAIYTPLSETLPAEWVIDINSCLNTPPNYLPCQRCVEVCDDDAIHFDMPLETFHERQVGSVVLAPGFEITDNASFAELGYGKHPDIVMSAELQRLLESPGPTGGFASKPSNEEYPESVLLVLDNLSRFGLYIVASQVRQLLAQDVETVAVLVLSPLASDSDRAEVEELAAQTGVQVRWGTMFKAEPTADNTLDVSFEDFSVSRYVQETYDMVVLCSDVQPPEGLADLADTVNVRLAASGYIEAVDEDQEGVSTSRPGIFVAGCASGPKNIKETIAEAQAAANCALTQLDPRLLASGSVTEVAAGEDKKGGQVAPDEMRGQIEKLLYALISRA